MAAPSAVWLAALLVATAPATVHDAATEEARVLEIRSYNLKPGSRERFHALFLREALPMLQRWKVDVVAYGPSRHDGDSYYLMRAFDSVEDRRRSEDAFYDSEEWKNGPRDAVLSHIVSYATVVIAIDGATLRGLRRTDGAAAAFLGGGVEPAVRAGRPAREDRR